MQPLCSEINAFEVWGGSEISLFLSNFEVWILTSHFLTFWRLAGAQGSPKGSQNPSTIHHKRCKSDALAQKGPQGGPRYTFSLFLEVLWRYFGSDVGGILWDVRGMFVSVWEAVWNYTNRARAELCRFPKQLYTVGVLAAK